MSPSLSTQSKWLVTLDELREFLICPKRAEFHRRRNISPPETPDQAYLRVLKRTLNGICVGIMEGREPNYDRLVDRWARRCEEAELEPDAKPMGKFIIGSFVRIAREKELTCVKYPIEWYNLRGFIDYVFHTPTTVSLMWIRPVEWQPEIRRELPLVRAVYHVVGEAMATGGRSVNILELNSGSQEEATRRKPKKFAHLRKDIINLVHCIGDARYNHRNISPRCRRCPYRTECEAI